MAKQIFALAALSLALCLFPAMEAAAQPGYSSFRDIPGVTQDEIKAIDAIREKRDSLVFGMTNSTEAFYAQSGEIKGFSANLCDWLSKLFEIPFKPSIYDWGDLIAGLESGQIDFTGELTANDERRKSYFMTDAISERSMKYFQLENGLPLSEIAALRPLRYALLKGTTTAAAAMAALAPGSYEAVFVSSNGEAYELLKSGQADAYINEASGEASFDAHGDIVASDFFPLTYEPVSMSARSPELKPVISAVQKMLRSGGIRYLAELYNSGQDDYLKNKFLARLTDEELEYIRSRPQVAFAAEHDNYPASFYNSREKQWQGIAIDILDKLHELTGIEFMLANSHKAGWAELLENLESGKVSMISELLYSEDRAGHFLWPKNYYATDYYALLSKSDYPDINVNEVLFAKVGLIQNTTYASLFKKWFPGHLNTVMYENANAAFEALGQGDVDMVMSSLNMLLILTHYSELVGFKANIIFNSSFVSTFGFNRNEAVLCSIVDKALSLIDTKSISGQWMRRTYDYQVKVAQARNPWFIGTGVMLLCVLLLLSILFLRKRSEGKRFEGMVVKRTFELKKLNSLMEAVNETAALLLSSNIENSSEAIDQSMEIICRSVEADRVYLWKNARKEDGHLYCRQVHKWMRESAAMGKELSEISYRDTLPGWERLLARGEIFNGALETIPDGGMDIFAYYQIKSILVVPLLINGEFWGFVSFDDCCKVRVFSEAEMHCLRSWGLLVVGAIQRNSAAMDMLKLHKDLKSALESSQAASIAKSQFLARMSHEIRTPMNVILGITEILLQNEQLSPEMEDALNKIYNSGDLLLHIINDILDLSKIEAGKMEIFPAEYKIASLINDTATLNMMRIGSKQIEFKMSVDENIPAVLIGDELRIKQILSNLLSNAFKYTESGDVNFSVSLEKGGKSDEAIIAFSVSDTGQGMTEEQTSKLFNDEYIRFNMEANRSAEGTGLGMNITSNLVKMMRGSISVKSKLNKGSVFTARLPQKIAGKDIIGKELALTLQNFELSAAKQFRKAQIALEPMPYGSVLIVDDVESNLYVAKGLMAQYKLSIDTAMSGSEAIGKIKSGKKYDLIFMDHMMPGMDGIEAVKIIREMGYSLPIVALTANAVAGQADMFMRSGFDDFISKPIDTRLLNAMLNKFVRDSSKKPEEKPKAKENPLIPIFIRDAQKAIAALEEIFAKPGAPEGEDLKNYIVKVHGMKSALASIKERELSSFALKLEQAGRKADSAEIMQQTPKFLSELRALLEKIAPKGESAAGAEDEDPEFLRAKLLAVQEACKAYDKKAAKEALAEIKQKNCSRATAELLASISELILYGDFDKAAEAAKHFSILPPCNSGK